MRSTQNRTPLNIGRAVSIRAGSKLGLFESAGWNSRRVALVPNTPTKPRLLREILRGRCRRKTSKSCDAPTRLSTDGGSSPGGSPVPRFRHFCIPTLSSTLTRALDSSSNRAAEARAYIRVFVTVVDNRPVRQPPHSGDPRLARPRRSAPCSEGERMEAVRDRAQAPRSIPNAEDAKNRERRRKGAAGGLEVDLTSDSPTILGEG